MDFIDDNDFIPAVDRFVLYSLTKRPHLIDPAVRSSIDLYNIYRMVFVNLLTKFTFIAGSRSRSMLAVQGFG